MIGHGDEEKYTAQREPGSDARQGLTAGDDDHLMKNIQNKPEASRGEPL